MCLYEVDFAMKYDKRGKFFYGEGFKAFRVNMYDNKLKPLSNDNSIPRVKRWVDAQIESYIDNPIISDKSVGLNANGYDIFNRYIPGYHIWLSAEDAQKYYSVGTNIKVVPVLFKDVLAYGTNLIAQYNKSTNADKHKPCVIARQMKVLSYE